MRSHLFVLALSIPMAACAMEVAGDEEPALDESEIILHNKLTTEQIVLNSLTGSASAIGALISNPLTTETFAAGGALALKLEDANARVFLKYLAECALPAGAGYTISYKTLSGKTVTFPGKHGLCGDEWHDGDPSPECKELVTACLLARNNAEGVEVRVKVSGRDINDLPFPSPPTVPAKSTTMTGATIASFKTCSTQQTGAARNCGFSTTSSLVGVCNPGDPVTLSCKAGSGEIAARVCDTPEGCNHTSPLNLKEGAVCGALAQSMSFTCGEDGAFSAMIGPLDSTKPLAGSFASAAGGTFPASENLVFPYEEGSFYGSFFEPGDHNSSVFRDVDISGKVITSFPNGANLNVFHGASSCQDPSWTDDLGYYTHRLCALDVTVDTPGGPITADLCAAENAGNCVGVAPRCTTADTAPLGDGDNDNCSATDGTVYHYPLTTRLHQPCDLIPPGFEPVCERVIVIR
ncbi:MAG TPA: hypothetical protein VFU21_20275 [Kofleriaceae bacterium]|nr:hypothetical protein [Kofleriaceae bacterium]